MQKANQHKCCGNYGPLMATLSAYIVLARKCKFSWQESSQENITASGNESMVPSRLRQQLSNLTVINRAAIVGVDFSEHAGRLLR